MIDKKFEIRQLPEKCLSWGTTITNRKYIKLKLK